MAGDGAGVDWDEPPWVAPPLGGRGIVVGEDGEEEGGGLVVLVLGEEKSERNGSDSSSSYARPRSNEGAEADEAAAVQ